MLDIYGNSHEIQPKRTILSQGVSLVGVPALQTVGSEITNSGMTSPEVLIGLGGLCW